MAGDRAITRLRVKAAASTAGLGLLPGALEERHWCPQLTPREGGAGLGAAEERLLDFLRLITESAVLDTDHFEERLDP